MKIFSYLPNPRVIKAQIAAEYSGATLEIVGDKPAELANWLWDADARPLRDEEKTIDSPHARLGKRGFTSTLYKTDDFLMAHPYGTVPAAFSDDGNVGIFESNSILRAAARSGPKGETIYPQSDPFLASRIDSFLDASLVFGREFQVYLLALANMTDELYERMQAAYEFYLSGIELALSHSKFLASDQLTIADISFACELAQFLSERKMVARMQPSPRPAISRDLGEAFPKTYQHLKSLTKEPNFNKHISRLVRDLD